MANKLLHPQKYHPQYKVPDQDMPIAESDRQLIKRLEKRVADLEKEFQFAEKMIHDIIDPMQIFMKERIRYWDGDVDVDVDVDTALLDYTKQLEERLAKLEASQDD